MAGPIPLLGLLDELRDFANRRNIGQRMVGGGVRGAATRGLLGMDAPENATKAEREVYENAARAAAPVMGLAAAPAAIKTAGRALKDAPRAQALETARQNAVKMLGLPENNTAMDRARALGFEDAYHGTNVPIEQIDKSKFGTTTGAVSAKQAWWASDSPEVARGYAENAANDAQVKSLLEQADKAEKIAHRTGNWDAYDDLVRRAEELEASNYRQPLNGQTIMPLSIRSGNANVMDAGGRAFVDTEQNINQFLRQGRLSGKDLSIINNLDDAAGRVNLPAKHFGIFNPAVVRSRFAAFDPARMNENDLLASLAAMGISIPMILGLLDEERVD